jgi:formate dehydrogenase
MGSTPSQLGTPLSHEEPNTKEEGVKIVMVLYPGNGHEIEFGELEGQPVPGSADGEIGLRQWLESEGHELVTTTDREGGELEENLGDADVLITTPFWPVYVTGEMRRTRRTSS